MVNVIGGASKTPSANFMIGGAVNAAITNFTKALAELGLRDGVAVKAVHPGMTVTGRLETLLNQRAEAEGMSREAYERQELRAPACAATASPRTSPTWSRSSPRPSPSRSTARTCSSTAAPPRRSSVSRRLRRSAPAIGELATKRRIGDRDQRLGALVDGLVAQARRRAR